MDNSWLSEYGVELEIFWEETNEEQDEDFAN